MIFPVIKIQFSGKFLGRVSIVIIVSLVMYIYISAFVDNLAINLSQEKLWSPGVLATRVNLSTLVVDIRNINSSLQTVFSEVKSAKMIKLIY